MSRIRVAITKARKPIPSVPSVRIWNVGGIDEFVEQFVRSDSLVINDYRLPIRNFIKHDERTATFDGMNWFDFGEIECALAEFGLHNIKVNPIDDNQDPSEP